MAAILQAYVTTLLYSGCLFFWLSTRNWHHFNQSRRMSQLQAARLEQLQVEMQTQRLRQRGLEEKHGTRASLRQRVDGAAASRVAALQELKRKEGTVTTSISNLCSGIEEMRARVAQANRAAFGAIRQQVARHFAQLVPSMEVDMTADDPEQLDNGVSFRIRSRSKDVATGAAEAEVGWREGLQELSGGQRTLLKISVLLAVAKYRPSMVVLMDEVDASLDEHNTGRVASMLKEMSKTMQVVAISHRAEFHRLADHMVQLHKSHDQTVAKPVSLR